jgi:hypothetical protein
MLWHAFLFLGLGFFLLPSFCLVVSTAFSCNKFRSTCTMYILSDVVSCTGLRDKYEYFTSIFQIHGRREYLPSPCLEYIASRGITLF